MLKNINDKNSSGETPLIYACLQTYFRSLRQIEIRFEIIKLLIECGADVNMKNITGKTAFHIILQSSREDKVKIAELLLKSGADPNIIDCNNMTAFEIISCKKYYDQFNNTEKSINQNTQIANLLKNHNMETNDNWNRISQCVYLSSPIFYTLLKDLNSLKQLIKGNPSYVRQNINTKNNSGETPIFYACQTHRENKLGYINILIETGADVNLQNNYGNTPLHLIIKNNEECKVKIAKRLIEAGANPNIFNSAGETIFDLLNQNITSDKLKQENLEILNLLKNHTMLMKKTDVEQRVKELETELSLKKAALDYMNENKVEEVNENELKVYQALSAMENQSLSKTEKAKLISDLIKK